MRWFRLLRPLLLSCALLTGLLTGPSFGQDSPEKTFADNFRKRIVEKDVDGAAQLIEENTDLRPEASAPFRIQLGALLLQADRKDDAAAQFQKALEATYAKLEDGSDPLVFTNTLALVASMLRQDHPELAEQWIDKGLTALGPRIDSDQLSKIHATYGQILRTKIGTRDKEAADRAKEAFLAFVARCEKIYAGESEPSTNAPTMLQVWSDSLSVADDANAARIFDKIQSLAQSQLKQSPTTSILALYSNGITNFVSRNARSAPDLASDTLASAKEFIDALESEDPGLNRMRENFNKTAERLNKTIESARALAAMIGNPAPAIDPMEWVNGEPETLDSLKGKVVMLDFWAVWCGPCIATFPHLKHLDAEYGPQGLTIIGVTRQYNFSWDDATSSASRSEGEVSLEEEMAMLEKFIAKHELTHRSMLTPKESSMQSAYLVTGIPHAVLIDKRGNVRMVRVGSGEQNAKDLEDMIKTLVAE